ncbi:serine/threonine-protein kinase 31-like isoform X1 [Montipora capricornis]|uniref:serine/threonine-protein kinase 31-like isoform X1 n=2 Tax=Montipora capricornis TaxID=246305 RepID=UPI0035F0FCD9
MSSVTLSAFTSDSNNLTNSPGIRRESSFEDGVDAQPLSCQFVREDFAEEKIYVTHVESPLNFWAQSAEHESAETMRTMSNNLQIYCRNKPLLQSTPHIGKVYGGVYPEDKKWYRCRVKKLIEDDKAEVHFVDFGNTDVISLRTIVFLSHEILSVVPFAQLYCLDGVATNKEFIDKGTDILRELIGHRVLTVKLKETKVALDVACPVELRDNSEGGTDNIADEMIRRGLAMATEKDGPPPLSPRALLSGAVFKELEELRKDNEVLRSMIKVYQDKEKAEDEVQKIHCIEAAKDKDRLEQTVNNKVLELVSQVRIVKKLRDASLTHGNTSDVIREAIEVTRNNRINVESLKSLQQVKEFESRLKEAQKCLCDCKEKDITSDLVLMRDQARQQLCDVIELFLDEVHSLPLKEREQSLKLSMSRLAEERDVFVSCSAGVIFEEAVQAFEKWQEKIRQDVMEVRYKVNMCSEEIVGALGYLQLALKMERESSDVVDQHVSFGDLDALIAALVSAAQEEIDKFKLSEDKEGKEIVGLTLTALAAEQKAEIAEIQELRGNLEEKYRNLKIDMAPWLWSKPDVKKISDVRKTIKSLRSRLRHRLADKKDLEEGDEVDSTEELQKVKSDLSVIYFQLHQNFEEERKCLAELAKAASDHFPELPKVHPELGIFDFLESNGLVKQGRELEHYPYHDSVAYISHNKYSIIYTEYGGTPCILKELSLDREFSDVATLQKRAVSFSMVNSPFLVPLEAFFVKGNRAFVQIPLMMKLEEWQASDEYSTREMIHILRDVLEGLRDLHTNRICHGCVDVQTVLVEKVDGLFRGRLDFYPISNPDCNKAHDMQSFEDLVIKLKITKNGHMLTLAELSEEPLNHE